MVVWCTVHVMPPTSHLMYTDWQTLKPKGNIAQPFIHLHPFLKLTILHAIGVVILPQTPPNTWAHLQKETEVCAAWIVKDLCYFIDSCSSSKNQYPWNHYLIAILENNKF